MTRVSPARAGIGIAVTVAVVLLAAVRPMSAVALSICLALLLGLGVIVAVFPGAGTAAPAARDGRQARRERWTAATGHHDDILAAYGVYELDPSMLLRYPAMWDLSAPPIVNFHDALDLAGSLRTDSYPGDDDAQEYVDAVSMLRTDWAAADRYARTTGTGHLDDTDAGECRRALGLLQHAEGTAGPERATYLEKVIGSLDKLSERGVVTAPAPMQDALTKQVQRSLESPQT